MKISRVSEMRGMDRTAIEKFGISPELLMENAGHAVYFGLRREISVREKRFVIFCGLGNNGGDGFVLARKLHANGGDVQVLILGEPDKYKGAAKKNYDILSRLAVDVSVLEDVGCASKAISGCDMIIDAIFGTGLSRDVEGIYREVIELVNASHKPVLSIDIPSGVHGDTGNVMGAAVKADITVTFGLPKLGNMLSPGYELGGKLLVSHISFPPDLHESDSLKIAVNQSVPLPALGVSGQKDTLGQLLTIGGSSKNFNAPAFCARSFLKSGGWRSRLAIPKSLIPFIADKSSEITLVPQEETASGGISGANKGSLLQLIEEMDIVVLGSGFSLQDETQKLARQLTLEITRPLLIVGDGIMAFYGNLDILRKRQGATVLVSHLGQMSHLSSKAVSETDEYKVDILQDTAASLNAIIVLMGRHSLIGYPDQRVFINMSGHSGLTVDSSDDIQAGAIAAMFCQGLSFEDAARQGVFIYGLAEDMAVQGQDEDGITAEGILNHLPAAVKTCRDGLSEELAERYLGLQRV
jgi:hydroxyethylthiazole kinase-like uncharacterized protein yjeF